MSTVQSLSYIVTQVQDLESWRHYAEEVLGMMTTTEADGSLRIKMDERPFRILVQEGATDVYLASGWELGSEEDFNAMLKHIAEQGVSYELGDREMCVSRGVQAVATLSDPAGNQHELSWGHISACQPFVSPQGVPRFVTDGMGLGHTVLPAPNFDECAAFYRDVLGFRKSDIFNFRPDPSADATRIHFMHCGNARHHSLAIAEYDVPSKCVHMMVEVDSMTEVGRAHDRREAHGVPLSATLGQHLNDKMTSFYMKTPSGFDLEFGWGGLLVDWEKHSVFEFNRVSVWGHDFSVGQQGEK
ncbi:MAG: biphenyl 2,3-dioxygenase [Gammaproteobacteria bacterium]|nr:biphenyl 2,3-dioxygenase [Gammaproteobacteria bacterium]